MVVLTWNLAQQEFKPSGESGKSVTIGAYARDIFLDQVRRSLSCLDVCKALFPHLPACNTMLPCGSTSSVCSKTAGMCRQGSDDLA